jgi:pimeloyl-ACP methyl ester carboxylesterase
MTSLGLLSPGKDTDYGVPGDPDWREVDWREHQRRVEVHGRFANVIDIGGGPAVFFVHGLGGAWQTFVENIPQFALDHRVIAMDLPGFGQSEMPAMDISIEYYAQWTCALADALEIESAAVVGNSMGGFIAAEMAIRQPERVQRLSLVSAAIFWQEYRRAQPLVTFARYTDDYIARLIADTTDAVAKRPRLRNLALATAGFRYPHLIRRDLAHELILACRRTEGFLPGLEALASFPLREELPKISSPALIVWGAHDALVGVKDSGKIKQLIPESRRVVFERTGHVPMLERPRRFNQVLREFLEEEPAQRSAPAEAPATA